MSTWIWKYVSCLVLSSLSLMAAPTATILGRVTDTSGGVVPNAAVMVNNNATGLQRTTVSTATGDFEIPLLPITGTYTLTVSASGFQTRQISGIVLQVDQEARFDVRLEVGSISEKVSVQAAAPLVNTDTGEIGQVINNRTIVELPLNGRNFTQLATLTPGAYQGSNSTTSGFTTIGINGGEADKTEFLLDGVSNQEQIHDGAQFTPSVDAIQEFKVQGSSFSAEYGRGDAIINATIKSGTNQFHGVLWEFLRNSDVAARNFFDITKPTYKQNQFGGTLGGPIWRNKTFFFLNYEGTRIVQGLTSNTPVPSAQERNGNFSDLSTSLKNPLTGQPLNGNLILPSSIDPVTAFYLKFIPLPNTPSGTFEYGAPFASNTDQGNLRVDHRFNDNDELFARYSVNNLDSYTPGALPQTGGVTKDIRAQNSVLDETHIFSPNVVNELRLGYGRYFYNSVPQGLGTNYTVQSGIAGFSETSSEDPGFPILSMNGYGSLINGVSSWPLRNNSNMYQLTDGLTWNKGAHSIKMGIDFRQIRSYTANGANSRGNFTFTGQYSGNSFADFLFGYPASGARAFPRNLFGQYQTQYAFYVQDDYKLSSRLTLNLGLRLEANPGPTFMYNTSSLFDLSTGKIIASQYNGSVNLTSQQVSQYAYPQFESLIETPQQAGLPNKLFLNQYNWAPRLGVAFRPFNNNKTVIRSGAGIFYLLQSQNNTISYLVDNPPFIVDESKSQPTVNGFPTTAFQNFFQPFSTNEVFNTPAIASFNTDNMTPYVAEWNFAIQQQLAKDLALEVAYVGSKGTHLEEVIPENLPMINANDQRPFQQRRPFPQFSTDEDVQNENNSTYHALQAKLEQRFSNGLSFLISYSYSKSIDGNSAPQPFDSFADPFDLHTMRGVSDYDIPQSLVASYEYELPFGRGKRFLINAPPLADDILGGWRVGGIVTLQSGLPFTPVLTNHDPGNVNLTYDNRPNVIGSGAVSNCTPQQCFNIADFTIPAPYTIGDAGRNILRGPGYEDWDLSVLKDFHFGETRYLQFRSEFFNVLNHTNFNNPNPDVDVPSQGGKIFSAKPSRIIQFALKLYF